MPSFEDATRPTTRPLKLCKCAMSPHVLLLLSCSRLGSANSSHKAATLGAPGAFWTGSDWFPHKLWPCGCSRPGPLAVMQLPASPAAHSLQLPFIRPRPGSPLLLPPVILELRCSHPPPPVIWRPARGWGTESDFLGAFRKHSYSQHQQVIPVNGPGCECRRRQKNAEAPLRRQPVAYVIHGNSSRAGVQTGQESFPGQGCL